MNYQVFDPDLRPMRRGMRIAYGFVTFGGVQSRRADLSAHQDDLV
jgi:hypothetical protein